MKRLNARLLWLSLAATSITGTIFAQPFTNLLFLDEFGSGVLLTNGGFMATVPSTINSDPTGGLQGWPVLNYHLPFNGVQGDLLIQETNHPGNPILDVLRFDGKGNLLVYSESVSGYTAPGDTPGPPNPFYLNNFTVTEQGVDGVNAFVIWTPQNNQPGWNAAMHTTYYFISDGVVPEPATRTLLLLALGMSALGRWCRKRRLK